MVGETEEAHPEEEADEAEQEDQEPAQEHHQPPNEENEAEEAVDEPEESDTGEEEGHNLAIGGEGPGYDADIENRRLNPMMITSSHPCTNLGNQSEETLYNSGIRPMMTGWCPESQTRSSVTNITITCSMRMEAHLAYTVYHPLRQRLSCGPCLNKKIGIQDR